MLPQEHSSNKSWSPQREEKAVQQLYVYVKILGAYMQAWIGQNWS